MLRRHSESNLLLERHIISPSRRRSDEGQRPPREKWKREIPLCFPFRCDLNASLSWLAEAEGFEPPWACTQTVFKFYPTFVACRLLLLFNSPNCRKISVLTARLSDTSGFLLCFGIVPRSLSLLIFSAFLTAFCRDFVDDKIIMLI